MLTALSLRSGASSVAAAAAPGRACRPGAYASSSRERRPDHGLPLTAGVATAHRSGGPAGGGVTGDENFLGSISAPASPLAAANAPPPTFDLVCAGRDRDLFGPNLAGERPRRQVTDSAAASVKAAGPVRRGGAGVPSCCPRMSRPVPPL